MRALDRLVRAQGCGLEEQDRLLGGDHPHFPRDPGARADQIEWVLSNREEAAVAARVAAERVRTVCDWRKTARAYLAALEDILAGRRSDGRASDAS